MVFVGFRSVQIWIFLCSFSPTCLAAEKISIRQIFFFFLGHRMGPEVPWPNGAHGAREAWRGGSGPRKKIRLLIGPGLSRWSRLAGRVRV